MNLLESYDKYGNQLKESFIKKTSSRNTDEVIRQADESFDTDFLFEKTCFLLKAICKGKKGSRFNLVRDFLSRLFAQVEYRDLYSLSRKILCKSAAENSAAAGYDRNAAVKIFVYHGYLPSLSDFETASQSPFIYAAPSARSYRP